VQRLAWEGKRDLFVYFLFITFFLYADEIASLPPKPGVNVDRKKKRKMRTGFSYLGSILKVKKF
jgi:hypothetical protein